MDGAINCCFGNIYIGCKRYETADAEGYRSDVSNRYGTDGVVQWSFDYGLSYTTFDMAYEGNPTYNSEKKDE